MTGSGPSPLPVYLLLGPTASGKTAVSLPLAERLGAEIVCLDSRQVFHGMAIGTAQPHPSEMARVPHHLFGLIDPGERFSAGDYGRLGRACLADLDRRGVPALFVGGAGLYLRALEGGLDSGLPNDPAVRDRWRQLAAEKGSAALHLELARRDPVAALRLHPNDEQRLTRALEVIELTGRRLSELQRGEGEGADLGGRARLVVLSRPRATLYARIAERTRELLAGGMIDEVRRQLAAGLDPANPALRAHGYPEIAAWLAGRMTHAAMEERLNQVTRNYVKRQFTWFRRLSHAIWIDIPDGEAADLTAERVEAAFRAQAPEPLAPPAGGGLQPGDDTQDLT